jgi:PAS domain S-box-containing protein
MELLPEIGEGKILLVEDDQALARLITHKLAAMGAVFGHADSGREAIARISENPPSLMLLDYSLPDMNGEELITRLSGLRPVPPFIVITGAGDERVAVSMMKLGARDYVIKDWQFLENLNVIVGRVLRQLNTEQALAEAQAALRENMEQLQVIYDGLADGIAVIDIETRKLMRVNQALCQMFRYSEEEMLSIAIDEMHPPERLGEVLSQLARIQRSEERNAADIPCQRSDSTYFYADITARSLIFKARPAIVGIYHDITDRKFAEEERKELQDRLARAEKMEAVGRLAGGVAHDLNNILSAVVAYPDLILIDLPDDSQLREDVLAIKNAGERAAAVIHDLLALSRRGISVREVSNVNAAVEQYLYSPEHAKLMSKFPLVKVEFEPDRRLLNVTCSGYNLFKLVMNLVSNAVESMPRGGSVRIGTVLKRIESPPWSPTPAAAEDYAVLAISDEGVGIPPENLRRIFEPFYTRKVMGRTTGSGLGLSVVWGIVQDHHGHIDVESKLENGTRMVIYLPATQEDEARPTKTMTIPQMRGSGEKILVIDDVPEQRELAKSILTSLEYTVVTASSGEEGIEYLKSSEAALVVLDMIMDPGIDGLETYKRIRAEKPDQKTIIVSGFAESERVTEALRLGVQRYLRKPYSLENLGTVVKQAITQPQAGPLQVPVTG